VGVPETSFSVVGEPAPTAADQPYSVYVAATPGFLEALGIPLRQGRSFTDADRAGAPPVIIVDEALARRFFPRGDALAQRLWNGTRTRQREIVGVVPHVRMYGLAGHEPALYQVYWPLDQMPEEYLVSFARDVAVTVRTQGAPLALADAVRRAVASVAPDEPVYAVRAYGEILRGAVAAERFSTALLALFAAVALALAAVGVYAVMAHAVSRRTHEIGVRMALGAQAGAVQRMVIAQGLRVVAAGLAVGLAAAAALARTMASAIPGAGSIEPAMLAAAVAVLTAVALAATWLPARRATRVDPTVALREE
jgi:predicted permease